MEHEVAIVGAGPLGLATAAELRRRSISVIEFDKGCVANTVNWFPRGMKFYSSPEFLELLNLPLSCTQDKPTREEYLAYLRGFVRYHGLQVRADEPVVAIYGKKGDFVLETEPLHRPKGQYRARRVVLAIGSTEFPRRLGAPG